MNELFIILQIKNSISWNFFSQIALLMKKFI